MPDWLGRFKSALVECEITFPESGARGTNVLTPHGTRLLKQFERIVEVNLEALGFQRIETPILVPENQAVETFGQELADRFIGMRLEERSVVLKTSDEPLVHPLLTRVRSSRQLPVELFSMTRVFREASHPIPLWRDREVLWYETQALYPDLETALDGVRKGLKYFQRLYATLGVSFLAVRRDSSQKTHPLGRELFSVLTPTPTGLVENGTITLYDRDALGYTYQAEVSDSTRQLVCWQVSLGHSARAFAAALQGPLENGQCIPSELVGHVPLVIIKDSPEARSWAQHIGNMERERVKVYASSTMPEILPALERQRFPLRIEVGPAEARGQSLTIFEGAGRQRTRVPYHQGYIQSRMNSLTGDLLAKSAERLEALLQQGGDVRGYRISDDPLGTDRVSFPEMRL
jgi:hypothetical protein